MALNQPGQNNTSGANTPAAGGVTILKNQLKPSGRLKLVLTSDGTGNQSNVNVSIFPGLVLSNASQAAFAPDGTHITLTSSLLTSSFTELMAYLTSVKLHVVKMTISTSDVANWNLGNMLTIGKVNADGRVTDANDIMFNDYKVVSGSTVSDTITITDVDFTTGGNFFMKVAALKLSTSITFWFDYDATNEATVLTGRN